MPANVQIPVAIVKITPGVEQMSWNCKMGITHPAAEEGLTAVNRKGEPA